MELFWLQGNIRDQGWTNIFTSPSLSKVKAEEAARYGKRDNPDLEFRIVVQIATSEQAKFELAPGQTIISEDGDYCLDKNLQPTLKFVEYDEEGYQIWQDIQTGELKSSWDLGVNHV